MDNAILENDIKFSLKDSSLLNFLIVADTWEIYFQKIYEDSSLNRRQSMNLIGHLFLYEKLKPPRRGKAPSVHYILSELLENNNIE